MLMKLRKLAHRAAALPPRRAPGALLRSGRSVLRTAAADALQRFDPRLREGQEALWRIVPGTHDLLEALDYLRASSGRLPISAEEQPHAMRAFARAFPTAAADLVARADRACRGEVMLFGEAVQVGVHPDWQLDARSGHRWDGAAVSSRLPVASGDGSDVKWPWELGRLQTLPVVAHVYHLTGEHRYAQHVLAQTEEFIEKNPYQRGAQWMSPMDVALRAVSMSWAFELCRDTPAATPELRPKIYRSLWAHGRFLATHLEETGLVLGNHLIADLLGLCWLGFLYPRFVRSARWRTLGLNRLRQALATQVRSDGGSFEASTSYHRLVFEMLAMVVLIARANGEPVDDLAVIAGRMGAFTAGLLQPDGRVPQLGDNDGGRVFRLLARSPNDQRYVPSLAAVISGDAELAAFGALDPEAQLLCGPVAAERYRQLRGSSEAGTARVRNFPASGICTYREGELFALFVAAPPGQDGLSGHSHHDRLSFLLHDGGDLIVDPGTYAYTSDPDARNRFRSSCAHAVPEVDGASDDPLAWDLFFLWQQSRVTHLSSEASPDGARFRGALELPSGVRIERRVAIGTNPVLVRIEDQVSDTGGTIHTLRVRFPLAPEARIDLVDPGRARLLRPGRRTWEVRAVSGPHATFSVEEGEYSETYGSKVRSAILVVTTGAPASFTQALELRAVE